MEYKKKLLFAVVFASGGLFSTNVIKADAVDSNLEPNTTQVGQAVSNSSKTSNPTVNNSDPIQTKNSAVSNTNQMQTRSQFNQASNDQSVDGVYTVKNQYALLYDANGIEISNRALGSNTAWYTDSRHTLGNGTDYYRVSTEEFAKAGDGTYRPYVQPYQGEATVVYKTGSSIHSYSGYGDKAIYNGTDLSTGSSWKVNNHANVGGKEWYQIATDTWIPQDEVVINNGQYQNASWISGVPLIAQRPELPNGCEITAVTMMLKYAGADVNKMQMAQEMPRSGDPNYGYIGQPWNGTGITIFPSALMDLVNKYAGSAKDLTGQNFEAIKYQINIGHPVVTWHTMYGFPYHALVVTGYDPDYVYYNDCWTDQSLRMGINDFIRNWNTQKRRAISY